MVSNVCVCARLVQRCGRVGPRAQRAQGPPRGWARSISSASRAHVHAGMASPLRLVLQTCHPSVLPNDRQASPHHPLPPIPCWIPPAPVIPAVCASRLRASGGAAVYGSGPEPELKGLLNPPIDVELEKPAPVSVRYYESKRYFTGILPGRSVLKTHTHTTRRAHLSPHLSLARTRARTLFRHATASRSWSQLALEPPCSPRGTKVILYYSLLRVPPFGVSAA